MIFNYLPFLCTLFLWTMLVFVALSAYIYLVNARHPNQDSNRRKPDLTLILFAPILIPIFIGRAVFLFALRAVLFGVFLVLFKLALIFIRKPVLFAWLEKLAREIGEPVLGFDPDLLKVPDAP